MSKRSRRLAFALLTLPVVLVAVTAVSEVGLRLMGRRPWRDLTIDRREPTMNEPDPVRGWRNRPGTYEYPGYEPGSPRIRVTKWPDGTRATSLSPVDAPVRLAVVGGSYSIGVAISDEETFAWRLQQRLPDVRVANHGHSGYGTYQSLLLLEELFDGDAPPDVVLYGFSQHHAERNVAPAYWLELLASLSRRGHVQVPYCTLEDGRLRRHALEGVTHWPLRDRLAVVNLAQRAWWRWRTEERRLQAHAVTERLLIEMRELCARRGAALEVALLSFAPSEADNYGRFLAEQGIPVIDCDIPITDELRVPGEGHPNGELHRLWAERMAAPLEAAVARACGPPARH